VISPFKGPEGKKTLTKKKGLAMTPGPIPILVSLYR